jgi:hypothetical protein
MSELDKNVPEGTNNKGEEDKGSGDAKTVSKEEFDKVSARVEGLAKKNEELVSILTSPNFMADRQKPEPKPEPKVEPEEKLPTSEEITDNPSKLVSYVVSKVGRMLDEHGKKQDERDKNISASIQKLVDTDEDREAQRQIKSCISEFGEKEFDDQREDMVKIAGQYPGISARDCFMIAVGKKNPPKKAPVPTGVETEKTGQAALFKDANLTPKEAVEKAFEMHAGGKKD